jgi:hypothetical protein
VCAPGSWSDVVRVGTVSAPPCNGENGQNGHPKLPTPHNCTRFTYKININSVLASKTKPGTVYYFGEAWRQGWPFPRKLPQPLVIPRW